MKPNYEIKEILIEKLYVNPDNARFINSEELPDELAAIEELVSMQKTHIDRLAKDIAENGLNPNELPIVIPASDNDGHFLVMDGNRRIASIKLMTQYKNELDNIKIESSKKRKLLSLKCDIKTVMCVLYEKEEDVNSLIEKLHTSKPGVAQVMWDPQAQDRHRSKNGETSRRLALIEMLRFSEYTPEGIKRMLDEGGWVSKLTRFISKKYISFFGIDFDDNNNIILYLEEQEVIKGLSQLVTDLYVIKADFIAQKKEVREQYLLNFPIENKPNQEKVNKTLVIFNIETKKFITTNIENDKLPSREQNEDTSSGSANVNSSDEQVDKKDLSSENNLANNKEQPANQSDNEHSQSKEDLGIKGSQNNEKKSSNNNSTNFKSTIERTTLIPKDENIPITNQRTLDLYKELKMVSIINYTNIVSIAFRSLVEFSLNCFLEKKNNKWANNEQITLFQKLDKVIKILENEVSKSKLTLEIPAIYRSIDSYKALDKKNDINSITNLNVIIHSHNYHPTDIELKNIYNNYSPLLKRIWEKI